MKNRSIITLGNPNGIGPEITAKALAELKPSEIENFSVIGDKESFERYFSHKLLDTINTIEVNINNFHVDPGNPTIQSGLISYQFLIKAVELIKTQEFDSLITAPIAKDLIASAGISDFTGHTTFLARAFKKNDISMLFVSEDLQVLLATIHEPVSKISEKLTKEKLRTAIKNALNWCDRYFGLQSTIGVCGLNPHAGENGLLGDEENTVIRPVIKEFDKHRIFGPFPADSLFYKVYKEKAYDLIIAMYHDQGLGPFKLLHFHDGINITLGLPFIRTSPDHGTAFSIAGKGKANYYSMLSAIQLARKS